MSNIIIMNMRYTNLIGVVFIISSLFFLGCIGEPVDDSPIPTPTVLNTPEAPVVPTAPAPPPPTPTPVRIPTVYKSDVDEYYGFYRVIDTSNKPAPFDRDNRTLTIYAGDTVVWVNDGDERFTIVSKEGLWDNQSSLLKSTYKQFNYTFTQPGTYDVYLKEYPLIKRQKIIVNS